MRVYSTFSYALATEQGSMINQYIRQQIYWAIHIQICMFQWGCGVATHPFRFPSLVRRIPATTLHDICGHSKAHVYRFTFSMGCDQIFFRKVVVALVILIVVALLYFNVTLPGMPNHMVVQPASKTRGEPSSDIRVLLLNNCITACYTRNSTTTGASTNTHGPLGINKMIIYGKYRTGSTFTSEFFFQHPDIAFMFEPLRIRRGEEPVTDGQRILWDMFNCQFRTSSVQRIMKRWLAISVFCEITHQFPGCVNGKKYPIGNAEKHCKQTRTYVLKVIQ